MRTVIFLALSGLFTAQIFGQISPANPDSTAQPTDTTTQVPIFIPEEPYQAPAPASLAELLYRTQQGDFDPVRVIGETVNKESSIIDSLRKILWEESEVVKWKTPEVSATESEFVSVPTGIDTLGLQRIRIYALLALDAMNKSEAYVLLKEVVTSHSNTELRGIALNTLSTSMHEQLTEASTPPAKELIQLFLRNADDTTHVGFCAKSVGEIARKGLQNWTGKDFGDIGDLQRIVKVGEERTELTVKQYREWWWERNNNRLRWNNDKRLFELL